MHVLLLYISKQADEGAVQAVTSLCKAVCEPLDVALLHSRNIDTRFVLREGYKWF